MNLGQIAKISSGHPFRGSIAEHPGAGVRAVQLKNVTPETGIDWETVIETDIGTQKVSSWLSPGDILFAARGNRNYAVLVESCPENAVASPNFYVIRPSSDKILPAFLAWQLNHGVATKHFTREAEGTLVKSIRRTVLENTPIITPNIEKQIAIVALYTAVTKERQIAEQLIRNGENMMNAIAFEQFEELKEKGSR